MHGYINFENQIVIMDSIIKSVAEIMGLFKGKTGVSPEILVTMQHIFKFLGKVIAVLPSVLVSDGDYQLLKDELIVSFKRAERAWTANQTVTEEFERAWSDLDLWWTELKTQLTLIQESKHTIYLSMN